MSEISAAGVIHKIYSELLSDFDIQNIIHNFQKDLFLNSYFSGLRAVIDDTWIHYRCDIYIFHGFNHKVPALHTWLSYSVHSMMTPLVYSAEYC